MMATTRSVLPAARSMGKPTHTQFEEEPWLCVPGKAQLLREAQARAIAQPKSYVRYLEITQSSEAIKVEKGRAAEEMFAII